MVMIDGQWTMLSSERDSDLISFDISSYEVGLDLA